MASAARAASEIPAAGLLRVFGRWGSVLALSRDPAGALQTIYQESGPIATLGGGRSPAVMVLGMDAHRQLLATSDLEHPVVFAGVPQPSRVPGEHSLLASYVRHQQDLWHANTIALTEALLQRWPVGREIDAAYAMTTLLFHSVWQTLFGTSVTDLAGKVEHAWRRWTRSHAPMPHLPFSAAEQRLRRISRQFAGDIRQVLAEMRGRGKTPLTSQGLLNGLVEQSGPGEDALIALIMLHFVVGHGCGSALSWTLFLLSQHPLMLVDLHERLWTTLHGSAPTLEQLEQMPLLHAIVDESLRLLPPFSIGQSMTTAALELAGYELAPGTMVMYSPLLVHRTPELYLWPHVFRPERWRSIQPEPYEYLPFGAHPDMVASMPLATMLIRLVLAMIVQHSFLGLAPGVRIDLRMHLMLEPGAGLPMVIAPTDRPVIRRTPEGNISAATSGL